MNKVKEKLWKIRQRILTTAAETVNYNWSSDYKEETMSAAVKNVKTVFSKKLETVSVEELKTLSREELYAEGFGNWKDELVLVPFWLLHYLSTDIELIDITGESSNIKDVDNDHRFGYLAYGFYL